MTNDDGLEANLISDYQPSQHDVDLCRAHAALYRARGFNPLPSAYSGDRKKPLVRFAEFWENSFPESEFNKFWTPSMQLMTGRFWRLMVIDLDGPEAAKIFHEDWFQDKCPRTWISRSGGNGYHMWFSIPLNYRQELPKGFLWKGEDKHSAIERLCDRSLIYVPPSIHPKSGKRYRFDLWHSPRYIEMPPLAPDWLLRRPLIKPDIQVEMPPRPRPLETKRPQDRRGTRKPWQQVIDEIPDKAGLAESWGLKFARGGSGGWLSCHAIGRDDKVASAQFHPGNGIYKDMGSGDTLGFPGLAVALGVYPNWESAMDDLRAKYER